MTDGADTSRGASAGRTGRTGGWTLPVVVFVVALAVRALTLLEERSGNPLFLEPPLDDRTYLRLADDLRDSGAPARPWFLAPLYPWMLAAASAGSPATTAVAGWLSVVTGALTAAVTAAAARAAHSPAAGWAAGLLYAAAGVLVFSEVLPGQEPVLCLLHAAALLFVIVCFRRDVPMWAAATIGCVVGLAVLGRATTATLGVAFAAIVIARVRPWRRAGLVVGVAAAGAVVVLLPAALRNASEFGNFTPLPWSGGSNLYMANGPFSRQFTSYASREIGLDPDTMERQALEVAERAEGRRLGPYEASAYWTRRTWDERGPAAETAAHLGRKALLFWNAGDVAGNHDVVLEREWSTWLGIVPVSSWWILALGVGGWWIARRRAPELDWAALTFVLAWAALTVYFPLTRYKLPLLPLAVVAIGAGAAELATAPDARRRAVVGAALVAVASALAFVGTPPVTHFPGARNLALAFAARGQTATGIAVLRRSLETEPDDGTISETLGRLLLEEDKFEDAVEQFELSRAHGRWSAGVPEIYALVALGRHDAARRTALELADKPMWTSLRAEYFASWALADFAAGDRLRAHERLRAAEDLDKDVPIVIRARELMSR